MQERIEEYDFKIYYVKGGDNFEAYAVSRIYEELTIPNSRNEARIF